MDNFHLQVTPVEITYQSKDPVTLSCLFKKVAISTGHLLEKHEIKSSSQLNSGKASFGNGPIFSMSKEFELKNTKISLHFMAKKDRNISCIGSTELDVANLPNKPYSMLEVRLDNCSDPKARLKLEIQRRQQQPKQVRREGVKPEKMGLLNTQGQQKQQMLINRRANPNLPTAYEISRRNYKQAQTSCHDDKKTEKLSTSSRKGSYQKRQYLLNQTNQLNKTSKSIIAKNEVKTSHQSPLPRKQTPEPIQINKSTKQTIPIAKQIENNRYPISGKTRINSLQTNQNCRINNEQPIEQPLPLRVRPYQEGEVENIENYNRNGFHSLEDEKNHKYKFITQKLQLIHDKIANSKDKYRLFTEENQENNSELSQPYHRSCLEQPSISENQSQNDAKSMVEAINSFEPQSNSQDERSFKQETPKILNESRDSNLQTGQKEIEASEQSVNLQRKFENIKSVKTKSPEQSPPSQKTVSFKTSQLNKPLQSSDRLLKSRENDHSRSQLIDDKEIEQAEIQIYKKEIQSYKTNLASALKSLAEKDKVISEAEREIENYKESLKEKQILLNKLNHQYEMRFEENFRLKEKLADLEQTSKREESQVGELVISASRQDFKRQESSSKGGQVVFNEQLAKIKKKVVELQSQLRFKENENKCLILEIDNLQREKRNLEQELQIVVSRDKNEMTRKASLARIEQTNVTSLTQHTKRQNQALKSEVKILHQKLESLNSLFDSLLNPGQKAQQPIKPISPSNNEQQRKFKLSQQKCALLQEQLKRKKNELAQIVNLIWKHQEGDLMNEVFALITQTSHSQ